LGGPAASGGGRSIFFGRPSYQDSVASMVGHFRGDPDISMSAAVDGGALVFLSFITPGYYIVGGTSWSSPLFSGVVAIADQAAGHRLGLLNPALYQLASQGAPGIVDVTRGTNTVFFTQHGQKVTVVGYKGTPGYDLSTGLGTIDAAQLVPELAG